MHAHAVAACSIGPLGSIDLQKLVVDPLQSRAFVGPRFYSIDNMQHRCTVNLKLTPYRTTVAGIAFVAFQRWIPKLIIVAPISPDQFVAERSIVVHLNYLNNLRASVVHTL